MGGFGGMSRYWNEYGTLKMAQFVLVGSLINYGKCKYVMCLKYAEIAIF